MPQLLESFGLYGLHAAPLSLALKRAANVGHDLIKVEELLSGAQLAYDWLGSVELAFYEASPSRVWQLGKF